MKHLLILFLIFTTCNTFSQAEKYYIKITEDRFVVKRDSTNQIERIELFVDKNPHSFTLFYDIAEYELPAGICYIRKIALKDFVDYDWLISTEKISVMSTSSSLSRDQIYFVREYSSKFYEVFETWVTFEVE